MPFVTEGSLDAQSKLIKDFLAGEDRIKALEERLRAWRDDYARSEDGLTVAVPVYQIVNLIGEKP